MEPIISPETPTRDGGEWYYPECYRGANVGGLMPKREYASLTCIKGQLEMRRDHYADQDEAVWGG